MRGRGYPGVFCEVAANAGLILAGAKKECEAGDTHPDRVGARDGSSAPHPRCFGGKCSQEAEKEWVTTFERNKDAQVCEIKWVRRNGRGVVGLVVYGRDEAANVTTHVSTVVKISQAHYFYK